MKKVIKNSDNSKRKDNQLEQKDELAKKNSFSKTSEKSNGAFIETENTSTKHETATEDVAEEAIKNDGNQEKTNRIKKNTRQLSEQMKNVIETKSIAKNTANKSKSNDDSDLVTLILIILLVILALALFALIDGLLGGLLSLLLLIVIIVLILKWLDAI